MTIEGKESLGSMYGVVDSMRNMTQAMEELLEFLPQDYVWPTHVNVSPFSVYAEWGRDSSKDQMGESVWLVANSEGVVMNANFRPDWPECGASGFEAQTAAEWLQELTENWEWSAEKSNGRSGSTLARRSRNSE